MNKEEKKKNELISLVADDGSLVETIYNPKENKTSYVSYRDGRYKVHDRIHINLTDTDYEPISANNSLIKTKFIKLPSSYSIEKINNEELFKEIRQLIETYVQIPPDFLDVCTTYIMLSWIYDRFQTIPYLRVVGDFGTGKTTLLNVVGEMCYKSMISSGSVTTATVFRVIDQFKGTFVFDEADFKTSEMYSEIVKILNSGFSANLPVLRMKVRKDGEMDVQSFHVFGPKILGSRVKFGDNALESRNITQRLMPMTKINKPVHLSKDFYSQAEILRNKLLSFRFETFHKISADESTLEGISFPRLKQSSLALTSVAKYIGEEVYGSVKRFLLNYESELITNQSDNIEADVVTVIIDLMLEDDKYKHKIYMTDISNYFTRFKLPEYSDKPERKYRDKDSGEIVTSSNYIITAKKIGGIINKIGIQKSRDGRGFYIDLSCESKRIMALIERYGLTNYYEEKNNSIKDLDIETTDHKAPDILF